LRIPPRSGHLAEPRRSCRHRVVCHLHSEAPGSAPATVPAPDANHKSEARATRHNTNGWTLPAILFGVLCVVRSRPTPDLPEILGRPCGHRRGVGNSFQPAIDASRVCLTNCVIAPSAKMPSSFPPPPECTSLGGSSPPIAMGQSVPTHHQIVTRRRCRGRHTVPPIAFIPFAAPRRAAPPGSVPHPHLRSHHRHSHTPGSGVHLAESNAPLVPRAGRR